MRSSKCKVFSFTWVLHLKKDLLFTSFLLLLKTAELRCTLSYPLNHEGWTVSTYTKDKLWSMSCPHSQEEHCAVQKLVSATNKHSGMMVVGLPLFQFVPLFLPRSHRNCTGCSPALHKIEVYIIVIETNVFFSDILLLHWSSLTLDKAKRYRPFSHMSTGHQSILKGHNQSNKREGKSSLKFRFKRNKKCISRRFRGYYVF